MITFTLHLHTGDAVPCVLFDEHDNAVYAHEPICDTYASVADLLTNCPGVIENAAVMDVVSATTLDPEAA